MTKDKFIEIVTYLKEVIKGTKYEGHLFTVGGSVRDYVMGNKIKDIDLVIDLDNGGIEFADYLYKKGLTTSTVVVYPTFGTAMLRLNAYPNDELEAVYTRGEKYVDGSRNPQTKFATLNDDCYRRDLTINALYYDITNGNILDLTNKGLHDIEHHIIRVTNDNPDIVFTDDPLRILRVIRFASRYGWKIEDSTYESMKRNVDGLKIISQERITSEFNEILTCKNSAMALDMIFDLDAFKYVLGGNVRTFAYLDLLKDLVSAMPQNLEMRLAALLHNNLCEETRSIMVSMKYPKEMIEKVILLNHFTYYTFLNYSDMPYMVSRIQYECGDKETFDEVVDFLDTYYCVNELSKVHYDYEKHYKKYFEDFRKMALKKDMYHYKLPINGNDIMEHFDIKPSATVGAMIANLIVKAFEINEITREDCFAILDELYCKQ